MHTFPVFGIDFFIIRATLAIGKNLSWNRKSEYFDEIHMLVAIQAKYFLIFKCIYLKRKILMDLHPTWSRRGSKSLISSAPSVSPPTALASSFSVKCNIFIHLCFLFINVMARSPSPTAGPRSRRRSINKTIAYLLAVQCIDYSMSRMNLQELLYFLHRYPFY